MKCRFHCRACGEHFQTLAAFDDHRQGDFDLGRYCVGPDDLGMAATKGTCSLVAGHANDPIVGALVYREQASDLKAVA